MRAVVFIIGLLLGIVLFVQSVLVYGIANATDETAFAWGVMVALLWLVFMVCARSVPIPPQVPPARSMQHRR